MARLYRGPQPWTINRARVLRSDATSAEAKLWSKLRNRGLGGLKFIRQAPLGPYFVDFLCRERRLVLEVDGATHGTEAEIARDASRTADIERLGYRVVRVMNEDVRSNIEGVLEGLHRALEVRD